MYDVNKGVPRVAKHKGNKSKIDNPRLARIRNMHCKRKINIKDMLVNKGQNECSITKDLARQKASITIGQLVVRYPSLRRELHLAISIRRKKTEVAYAYVVTKNTKDLHALQVEAMINVHSTYSTWISCGWRSVLNVMANWLLDGIDM